MESWRLYVGGSGLNGGKEAKEERQEKKGEGRKG